jgi:hypothetical protein
MIDDAPCKIYTLICKRSRIQQFVLCLIHLVQMQDISPRNLTLLNTPAGKIVKSDTPPTKILDIAEIYTCTACTV